MYRQIQVINKFKTGRERSLQSFFGRNIIKNIKICDIYKFNDMPSKKNYKLACGLLSNPISQQTFTTKNVDENGLYCRIAQDNLESCLHLFLGGTATHIEKIRGLASKKFDNIHGGHGQPCSVHHASDVAIVSDVI